MQKPEPTVCLSMIGRYWLDNITQLTAIVSAERVKVVLQPCKAVSPYDMRGRHATAGTHRSNLTTCGRFL